MSLLQIHLANHLGKCSSGLWNQGMKILFVSGNNMECLKDNVYPLSMTSENSSSLKSAPSMIYLPVEFKRFPTGLTLCNTSQFIVAQRPI